MSTYLVHYANARQIAANNDHWNHERRTRSTRRAHGWFTSRRAEG